MGKIDVLDRQFFAEPKRFAELINMELYQGRKVLVPERLTRLTRSYPSLSSSAGEKDRDILMHDTEQNLCYGLEIETESDYSMPERVMVYDACEYEYQIKEINREHKQQKMYQNYREKKSRMKKEDSLIPAVTMVLYLGEGHWCGRRSMQELFGIPEQRDRTYNPVLQNYGFPLMEADYIDIQNYHTDLKEFFQAMQCRGNREKLKKLCRMEEFRNLYHETEVVISAHLNNKILLRKVEEEGMHMCKALDEWLKEEKQNGRREERIRLIRNLQREGIGEAVIKRVTKCSLEEYAAAVET